jgi:hypothetical protein
MIACYICLRESSIATEDQPPCISFRKQHQQHVVFDDVLLVAAVEEDSSFIVVEEEVRRVLMVRLISARAIEFRFLSSQSFGIALRAS